MKVGAILAVAGAVVGEFIASERGLGYLMIQVQSSLDTPAMVMAVVLLTLLGRRPLRPGARPRTSVRGPRRQAAINRAGRTMLLTRETLPKTIPRHCGARRSLVPAEPGADRRPRQGRRRHHDARRRRQDGADAGAAWPSAPRRTPRDRRSRASASPALQGVARSPRRRDHRAAICSTRAAVEALPKAHERRLHGRPQVRRRTATRR